MPSNIMTSKQEDCTHHWVIDSSDLSSSNKSNGKCKKCNLIKTFFNSIAERDYKWKINLEKSEQLNETASHQVVKLDEGQETKNKLLARGYNLDDLDDENPYNNTGDTS